MFSSPASTLGAEKVRHRSFPTSPAGSGQRSGRRFWPARHEQNVLVTVPGKASAFSVKGDRCGLLCLVSLPGMRICLGQESQPVTRSDRRRDEGAGVRHEAKRKASVRGDTIAEWRTTPETHLQASGCMNKNNLYLLKPLVIKCLLLAALLLTERLWMGKMSRFSRGFIILVDSLREILGDSQSRYFYS